MTNAIFSPFSCRGLALENRIVMAPMTRSFSPKGVPGEDVASYYERRAEADVGLILTEGTTTDRLGAGNDPNVPMFHGDAPLKGWEHIRKRVHAVGGKIAPQLWHTGMMRKSGTGHYPDAVTDSPSGLTHKGKAVAQAPTETEVDDMVMSFADEMRRHEDIKQALGQQPSITLQDERLSTHSVDNFLDNRVDMGKKRKIGAKDSGLKDALAAQIILQAALDGI